MPAGVNVLGDDYGTALAQHGEYDRRDARDEQEKRPVRHSISVRRIVARFARPPCS